MKRSLFFLVPLFCLLFSISVLAVDMPSAQQTITVYPKGTPRDTTQSIQEALDTAKTRSGYTKIVFSSGATYQLDVMLEVYSNTIIEASGATIQKVYTNDRSKTSGMLCNARSTAAGGYNLHKNIYIHGGTWTGGNVSQATGSGTNIAFVHVQNLNIWDAVIKNNYYGHLIELNAVKQAVIENCRFSGHRSGNSDGMDIAIQLDIASEQDDSGISDHESVPSGYLKDSTPCQDITVQNCYFNQDTTNLGIFHAAVGANKLLAAHGIYMDNIRILNNTISNTSEVAILARGLRNSTISGNTITNAGKRAIVAERCSGGTISNNTMSNTGTTALHCLNWISSGSAINITNNKINACSDKGILLEAASVGSISDNTISNTTNGSILVMNKSSIAQSINGNHISGSSRMAIYASNSSIGNIANNSIDIRGEKGILFEGSSGSSITDNTVSNATSGGILLMSNSNISQRISNNTIKGSSNIGLYINNSGSGSIAGNTISINGNKGILLENASAGNITDNNVSYAINGGILLMNKSKVTQQISGNTIRGTSQFAIYVDNSASGTIVNNNSSGGNYGVYMTNGSNGVLGANSCSNCIKATSKVASTCNVTKSATSNSGSGVPTRITAPARVTIGLNEKVKLPVNGNGLTFKSTSTKTVKVSRNGTITGKKTGTAKINITAADGGTAVVRITVKKSPAKVTLTKRSVTLKRGKTYTAKYKLSSGSASYAIKWSSNKKKIATVNSKGKIKAIRKGKATITVTTFNKRKATITVTVK